MKRYLALPGALLLIAAFIRAAVELAWDATSIAMVGAGAGVLAVAAVWNRREVLEWLRDPRGVFAVATGISVAIFIAVLVMLNIAVWYTPWSIDLTASGRNQVSDETRRILARIDQPVVLRQFGDAPDPRVEQLLRSFERENPRIRVEFADVARNRQQAISYGVVRPATVVVIAAERFRKIEEANEQALVTAILQVTSDRQPLVCFVAGHGERGLADTSAAGLSILAATLEASNYRTDRISLLEGDVPAGCGALVIAGARQPFTGLEMDRLGAYVDRSGRLALLLEPDPAPSFADWLRPRGFAPGPGVILDASGAGSGVGLGPLVPVAVRYEDHPITREFGLATAYDTARPVEALDRPDYGGRPTAIARTSPKSFATSRSGSILGFDPNRDIQGPLTLAAATTIRTGRRPDEETRIAVFGDSDFISNGYARIQGNRDLFLRTIAWLLGEQEATIVDVDNRENRRIILTERTRNWMYVINLVLLPLIPLSAGVVVYLRSR